MTVRVQDHLLRCSVMEMERRNIYVHKGKDTWLLHGADAINVIGLVVLPLFTCKFMQPFNNRFKAAAASRSGFWAHHARTVTAP